MHCTMSERCEQTPRGSSSSGYRHSYCPQGAPEALQKPASCHSTATHNDFDATALLLATWPGCVHLLNCCCCSVLRTVSSTSTAQPDGQPYDLT